MAQFVQQDAFLFIRPDAVDGSQVEHETQHASTLHMPEETVTKPSTFGGALNQAGDIGDRERGVVVKADHTEVRFQSGEGIVRDTWPCRRDHADQGALAHIGEPHQRDVGHQSNFEAEPAFLTMFTLFGKGGGTTTVREKPGVSAASSSTGNGHPTVTVTVEFGQHLTGVHIAHHGSFRNGDLKAFSSAPVEVLTFSVHTVPGPPVRVVTKRQERGDIVVGDEPDIATISAVTAIRPPVYHRSFTAERHTASTAISTAEVQLAFVDELGHADTLPTPTVAGTDAMPHRGNSL